MRNELSLKSKRRQKLKLSFERLEREMAIIESDTLLSIKGGQVVVVPKLGTGAGELINRVG